MKPHSNENFSSSLSTLNAMSSMTLPHLRFHEFNLRDNDEEYAPSYIQSIGPHSISDCISLFSKNLDFPGHINEEQRELHPAGLQSLISYYVLPQAHSKLEADEHDYDEIEIDFLRRRLKFCKSAVLAESQKLLKNGCNWCMAEGSTPVPLSYNWWLMRRKMFHWICLSKTLQDYFKKNYESTTDFFSPIQVDYFYTGLVEEDIQEKQTSKVSKDFFFSRPSDGVMLGTRLSQHFANGINDSSTFAVTPEQITPKLLTQLSYKRDTFRQQGGQSNLPIKSEMEQTSLFAESFEPQNFPYSRLSEQKEPDSEKCLYKGTTNIFPHEVTNVDRENKTTKESSEKYFLNYKSLHANNESTNRGECTTIMKDQQKINTSGCSEPISIHESNEPIDYIASSILKKHSQLGDSSVSAHSSVTKDKTRVMQLQTFLQGITNLWKNKCISEVTSISCGDTMRSAEDALKSSLYLGHIKNDSISDFSSFSDDENNEYSVDANIGSELLNDITENCKSAANRGIRPIKILRERYRELSVEEIVKLGASGELKINEFDSLFMEAIHRLENTSDPITGKSSRFSNALPNSVVSRQEIADALVPLWKPGEDLLIYVGTFNMNQRLPNSHEIRREFIIPNAHLIVIGTQENVKYLSGAKARKRLLLNWINIVVHECLQDKYELVGIKRMWGTCIMVLARKEDLLHYITSVEADSVSTGACNGLLGNKGGVGISLSISLINKELNLNFRNKLKATLREGSHHCNSTIYASGAKWSNVLSDLRSRKQRKYLNGSAIEKKRCERRKKQHRNNLSLSSSFSSDSFCLSSKRNGENIFKEQNLTSSKLKGKLFSNKASHLAHVGQSLQESPPVIPHETPAERLACPLVVTPLFSISFLFICCHLSAHQSHFRRRNKDYLTIARKLHLGSRSQRKLTRLHFKLRQRERMRILRYKKHYIDDSNSKNAYNRSDNRSFKISASNILSNAVTEKDLRKAPTSTNDENSKDDTKDFCLREEGAEVRVRQSTNDSFRHISPTATRPNGFRSSTSPKTFVGEVDITSEQKLLSKNPNMNKRWTHDYEPLPGRDVTEEFDVVIVLGDLNYRIEGTKSGIEDIVKRYKEFGRAVLVGNDQLCREMKNGIVFHGFREAELQFRPTYKYVPSDGTFFHKHKNVDSDLLRFADSLLERHKTKFQLFAHTLYTYFTSEYLNIWEALFVEAQRKTADYDQMRDVDTNRLRIYRHAQNLLLQQAESFSDACYDQGPKNRLPAYCDRVLIKVNNNMSIAEALCGVVGPPPSLYEKGAEFLEQWTAALNGSLSSESLAENSNIKCSEDVLSLIQSIDPTSYFYFYFTRAVSVFQTLYTDVPQISTSDHKPVASMFVVSTLDSSDKSREEKECINLCWKLAQLAHSNFTAEGNTKRIFDDTSYKNYIEWYYRQRMEHRVRLAIGIGLE